MPAGEESEGTDKQNTDVEGGSRCASCPEDLRDPFVFNAKTRSTPKHELDTDLRLSSCGRAERFYSGIPVQGEPASRRACTRDVLREP